MLSPGARQGFLAGLLERLNLRFPTLFLLFAALTLLDLVVPDPIPFLDELGLALLTVLLALWRSRRERVESRAGPTLPRRQP